MAATNTTVELFYLNSPGVTGGTWNDITGDVYTRDGITITRGRPDESQQIPPSTLNLTLKNVDGKYSARLPTSPLYGLIGRNTPIRVSAPSVTDTFTRNVSGSWGTPDVGPAWQGSASQYSTNGTAGLMSHGGSGALIQIMPVIAADVDIYVDIDPATPAGTGNAEYTIRTRRTNSGNNYIEFMAFGVQASAPTMAVREVVSGSQVQLNGFFAISGVTAGAPFRLHAQITGNVARLRGWAIGADEPTTWAATITNFNATNMGAGDVALRSSIPGTWTNTPPIVTSFDNFSLRSFRFYGEVESWPVRWDVSGKDVYAPITANGITRRLNAPGSTVPVVSALRRSHTFAAPHGYWPMEADAASDTPVLSLPSGKAGLAPLTLNLPGAILGAAEGPDGSRNLTEWTSTVAFETISTPPTIGRGASVIVGSLPAIGSVPTSWSASVLVRGTRATGSSSPVEWAPLVLTMSDGTRRYISIYAGSATFGSNLNASSTIATTAVNFPAFNPFDGNWHEIFVSQEQSGGNVVSRIYGDGVLMGSNTSAGSNPYPTGAVGGAIPTFNTIDAVGVNNTGCKLAMGHVRVDAPAAVTSPFYNASIGYVGETAARRIVRVCAESGIALTLLGLEADGEPMGPQVPNTTLGILSDAADADLGILYEPRESLGLAYRTRTDLYNQAATVTLNYAAGNEVAPPLEPVEDTDVTANDVTVTRHGGGLANVVQSTGNLNVQEPPVGVGRYAKSLTLFLAADGQCIQAAAWTKHLGTWDEARYPVANLDLTAMDGASKTTLIGNAANLDIGDRFSITNPPSWLPPDSIELMAQGFREELESHHWTIAVNATPGGPWDVYRIETDTTTNRSRIPAAEGETTLFEALTSGQTRVVINSTTVKWIDTINYAAQFPFDITASGERIRVTASANYLNANPYFETNAASWTTQNGATAVRSTAQFHEGAASLLITPDGSSFAPQATSEEVPAVAGRTYTVSGWIRSTGAATRKLGLFWYDASHSLLSSNEISTALSAGVWTQMGPTGFVAPANTAYLRIFTNDPSNPLASNTWFLDEATVTSDNLQVFTVTRSINGVTKAQTAGTAVQLFRPPRIAR